MHSLLSYGTCFHLPTKGLIIKNGMSHAGLYLLVATEHQRSLAGTKFYCTMSETHLYEQLAHSHYTKVEQSGVEAQPWS